MIRGTILAATLLLTACAQPLPPERASYVGTWQGEGVVLTITADGRVDYEREDDGDRVSIQAPITRFEGAHFWAGMLGIETRFEVSQPPTQARGEWRMTVDGRPLVRTDTLIRSSDDDIST